MNNTFLHTPIDYLKGVGPNRSKLFKKELKIFTYQDLLSFFPYRYVDKTKYHKIDEVSNTKSEIQIIGKIVDLYESGSPRKRRLIAKVKDDTGFIELVWFKSHKWIKENLTLNKNYIIYGKPNMFKGIYNIPHPELELYKKESLKYRSSLDPVYPSTENLIKRGITNKAIRNVIKELLLKTKSKFVESLPEYIIKEYKLLDKNSAIINIHLPKSSQVLSKAIKRLKFEELFYLQLQLIKKNISRKEKIKGYRFKKVGNTFNSFYNNHLNFSLTNAQKRVLKEIRRDLGSNAQMNRLLQGDVGSGKTIIAFMTTLIAIDNNFQACIMAPTEILSVQHYNNFKEICKLLNISIQILTGSTKALERRKIYDELENGKLKILIGTHALIQDKVKFKNLGIAIIDEQHKFGVAQRSKLWKKNTLPPHVLIMTATPIPRTLAMSVYGDLDISVIDELPPGRKNIITVHRKENSRLKVIHFLREEISKGRQAYIVYPLIKESEKIDYKDLLDGFDSLSRDFPLPEYQISIVHGKMKPEDKDYEMQRFISGTTDILVSTTVIEVGVDIPNASVMIIESAERFGLSQLHQLRGRVGRGTHESYCILMSGNKTTNDSKIRINTMVKSNDGFEIAEKDLEIRGPGNLMGTQQSGIIPLKIANLVSDKNMISTIRDYVKKILTTDQNLTKKENTIILNTYKHLNKNNDIWNYIS
ncbi:MAG: ATP-dependent DNA helicase RecG [Flavobacteriaceae bacterium]|nr:ATP-dependent DNA helicase RecG [Flavobacteriaceae bacterium]